MPNIDLQLEGIDKALRSYSPAVVHRAAKKALNRTVASARTAASEEIRKTYNIKKRDLDRKAMRVIKARYGLMTAAVEVYGRPISLAYFKPRQTKKGVSVRIMRGRGMTKLPHHFIATVQTKKAGITHTGVFKRLTAKHLPIAEPRMVSVPSVFAGKNVLPRVKERIYDRWPREFSRHLRYYQSLQR